MNNTLLFDAYKNQDINTLTDADPGQKSNEDVSRSLPVQTAEVQAETPITSTYILNTNTKKFHSPACSSVGEMKEKNKKEFNGTRDEIIGQGYIPCKRCNP